MGALLSTPVELVRIQRTGNKFFRCAVAEMQGHVGEAAANFCAPKLAELGTSEESKRSEMPSDDEITAVFEKVDSSFRNFVNEGGEEAGSTVVGALINADEDGTYSVKLMNCGDSRGIVVRDSNYQESCPPIPVRKPSHASRQELSFAVIAESVDHKPDHPVEFARIEKAGGFVSNENPARLDGNLAVSRGMGDFEYKKSPYIPVGEQKVSCVPDIYDMKGVKHGSFCLLACDGLWDTISVEFASGFVRALLKKDPRADLGEICSHLIKLSLNAGSRDNITVMIIHFTDGSDWSTRSNRFNGSDEMLNFERLVDGKINFDEDTCKHYRKFLRRCNFPFTPAPCSVSGRWYQTMYKCPGSGQVYCNRSCQKKGWRKHLAALAAKAEAGEEKKAES
eukprot:TRINITY_DN30221_c0_g1_i2.p1 TRINITY_DN30221_c0_g1~~TRINITY_DN30221_c0_g1_i2.p1  ORF type:complete len:437 (-),score=81.10 TRINITY_DN30221_c0_g1_i2:80-1261(-)